MRRDDGRDINERQVYPFIALHTWEELLRVGQWKGYIMGTDRGRTARYGIGKKRGEKVKK